MLDSDVYEMDATQFTMDAHQIKIELTTDVKQLVTIGWIEKEKELESLRIQELVKLNSLTDVLKNYEDDVDQSTSLKEKFNILSEAYADALSDDMIKKIKRGQNKILKDEAVAKKQKTSKAPLTTEQIKKIAYKKITDVEAKKLINSTKNYTLNFEHQDLEHSNLNYVVLSEQLKKLLDGLLVVDSEYLNIQKIYDKSEESGALKSKELKALIRQAKDDFKIITDELDEDSAAYSSVDVTKLSLGRRLIRLMKEQGYYETYGKFYEVKFSKFESDVEKLIGGTGIAKTLSDFSVYVEGAGKKFSDIDSLIKKQQRLYDNAERLSQDAEGQKKILTKLYTKQMAEKNDPKKKVDIKKALTRFRKIFPLIEKK